VVDVRNLKIYPASPAVSVVLIYLNVMELKPQSVMEAHLLMPAEAVVSWSMNLDHPVAPVILTNTFVTDWNRPAVMEKPR
jgi:hypothetical protein